MKNPWAPAFFLWLGILVSGVAIICLWPFRGYYFLPIAARALRPEHSFLRSSGKGGLTFGVLATILICINLSYLVRKSLIRFSWLGSLRSWMAFHVFTGLIAGVMVLLHSAFLFRSVLGVLAFFAMAIVVVTGLIGRYIYAHTPRSFKGKELELEEIRTHLREYQGTLEKMGLPQEFFRNALASQTVHGSDRSLVASIFAMAEGDRELRREHKNLRQLVRSRPALRPLAPSILPLAERYCQEKQWLARYQELRSLMGSWRFLHRWFAIVLVGAVGFHILVAFQMGNLWLAEMIGAYFNRFK